MLGRFEERILWELVREMGGATTTDLQEKLIEKFKVASSGALYTSLHRMVAKGFVAYQRGAPLPERGGKARNLYKITDDGRAALLETGQSNIGLGSISDLIPTKR